MKTLVTLFAPLFLLLSSCAKEKPDALYIKGHLIEHGSGNPIINSKVYLVRTTYEMWAGVEVVDAAETNMDGYFELNNLTRDNSYHYYLVGASSYHYEMERLEYEPYEVNPKTHWKDVHLYRKATMNIRVVNGLDGQSRFLNIWTPRDYKDGFEAGGIDSTFTVEVNGYVLNKIRYKMTRSGSTHSFDTLIQVNPDTPPTYTITN